MVINRFMPVLTKRLTDMYIINWREEMEAFSSLSLYRHILKITLQFLLLNLFIPVSI